MDRLTRVQRPACVGPRGRGFPKDLSPACANPVSCPVPRQPAQSAGHTPVSRESRRVVSPRQSCSRRLARSALNRGVLAGVGSIVWFAGDLPPEGKPTAPPSLRSIAATTPSASSFSGPRGGQLPPLTSTGVGGSTRPSCSSEDKYTKESLNRLRNGPKLSRPERDPGSPNDPASDGFPRRR